MSEGKDEYPPHPGTILLVHPDGREQEISSQEVPLELRYHERGERWVAVARLVALERGAVSEIQAFDRDGNLLRVTRGAIRS